MLYSSGLPNYSHSSTSQPAYTTGVVTFPEDQQPQQPPVIHPSHVMEPAHYSDQSTGRRAAGPIKQFSEEEILDSRNFLGEHIDYISSNLDSLQQILANQQTLFEAQGLNEILNTSEGGGGASSGFTGLPSQQDLLDAIADRAMPSPSLSSQQSHELVQYGQGMGSPQRSLRQHDIQNQGYGRKNLPWSQSNTQQGQYEETDSRNHYEVQDLFNG